MIGSAGCERWTENGQALHNLAEQTEMMVLNTVSNCKEPGWTWKRADGRGQGRIDYLLVSCKRFGQVKLNCGAESWLELDKEGSPTDHRPVRGVFNFKLLDESLHRNNSQFTEHSHMTQFNRILSAAYTAYHTDKTNQFTLHPKPVNAEHLEIAKNMLDRYHGMNQPQLMTRYPALT